jgi:hypothetical protein
MISRPTPARQTTTSATSMQIAKTLAFQYREEVGPCRELLTVLPRG